MAKLKKRIPICFVVSSPSGGGKTTIVEKILSVDPSLRKTISHTTRPKRPGETHRVHYHFTDQEKFLTMKKSKKLLEWAEVYGNFYGTSKSEIEKILKKGLDVILVIENKGAKTIRKMFPRSVFILILPPSFQELKSRVSKRAHSGDDVEKRLRNAKKEVQDLLWYDYVIVNQDADESADRLLSIIEAERARLHYHKTLILSQF